MWSVMLHVSGILPSSCRIDTTTARKKFRKSVGTAREREISSDRSLHGNYDRGPSETISHEENGNREAVPNMGEREREWRERERDRAEREEREERREKRGERERERERERRDREWLSQASQAILARGRAASRSLETKASVTALAPSSCLIPEELRSAAQVSAAAAARRTTSPDSTARSVGCTTPFAKTRTSGKDCAPHSAKVLRQNPGRHLKQAEELLERRSGRGGAGKARGSHERGDPLLELVEDVDIMVSSPPASTRNPRRRETPRPDCWH